MKPLMIKKTLLLALFALLLLIPGCSPPGNAPVSSPAQAVKKTDPAVVRDIIRKAQAIARQGDEKEAYAFLHNALKKYPKAEKIYVELSALHQRKGDYEQALDVLKKGVEKIPDSAVLLEEKAFTEGRLGHHEASVKTAQKILKMPGISGEMQEKAQLNVARAYSNKKTDNIKNAYIGVVEKIDRELKKKPGDELLMRKQARILRTAGEFEKAVEVYQIIKETEPVNLFASLQLGRTYVEMGDYGKAEEVFKNAVKKNPGNFRSYRNLGWFYVEMGKKKEGKAAVKMFDKGGENFKKAKDLSTLPVDRAFLQFKIAQCIYLRWRITNEEDDKKAALEAFEQYKKDAPEWVSTDVADDYVAVLKGEKSGLPSHRNEGERELTPVVK